MSQVILSELEHNKRRLDYYTQLKSKTVTSKKIGPLDKWIEIYSERVHKLERQVQKMQRMGLRVQLDSSQASSALN
jgi:hypothetical protein